MLKIPSYPICKTYENAYTFMNLEKSKNWKNPKNPNFKIQNPKIQNQIMNINIRR